MYNSMDYDFKKDDVIETPLQLAKFIYNKVKRKRSEERRVGKEC